MAARGPDHGHHGRLWGLWDPGRAPRPAHGPGAGLADRRPAGGAGLAQADLALPGAGLWVRTWTERVAAIGPRAVLTERARAEACRRVGKDAHAVAAVARDLGVGWATIMRAV